jgi:axial budding pattern protein 2
LSSSNELRSSESHHERNGSMDSVDSLESNTSTKTHAVEAIVQTATRVTSARNVRGGGAVSYQSITGNSQMAGTRPRLVPFTSAARVPVPRLPSVAENSRLEKEGNRNPTASKRVTSQVAKVIGTGNEASLDDLSIGMHYVRSLGGDQPAQVRRNSAINRNNASTPTISTNVRSSFSSLDSSRQGHGARDIGVKRMLVRAGEKFKFRVILEGDFAGRALEACLISGGPLPRFLEASIESSGTVVFQGTPAAGDIGEANVGIYTSGDGECVGRVIVEVVGRSA